MVDITSLVDSTIKTINSKKNLTPSIKQQAIRFYFWCGDNTDESCKKEVTRLERFLREKGILVR